MNSEERADSPKPGSGVAAAPPEDPLVGKSLRGTYQVVRRVAEGGMGIVYEGEHLRLKRRVAIKLLLSQYVRHPEVIARFRREAEVVGSLGHPHIVQVFDVDETEAGDPFLVMEFLEGETLAERLERLEKLPVPVALRIVSQIASALASTHEKGVVHRDLKPENIFLLKATGEKDFVKILDFGISKVRSGGPKLTQHNIVIGTPLYMAPEQARAEQDVDHRADQFALAAMLYEMLSGKAAFAGETPVEIMGNVIVADPPRLADIAPWVPEPIELVIVRALSKKAVDRYPNVSAFANALEAAADAAGVAATLPPGSRVAAREAETAPAFAGQKGSDRPRVADSLRTPPPPAPEHLVEHVLPHDRRAPTLRSEHPPTPAPSPSERPQSRPPSVRPPLTSPPSPVSVRSSPPSVIPNADSRDPQVVHAQQLLDEVRDALKHKRLDDAVQQAERLIDLAIYGKDAAVLDVLRVGLNVIDHAFEMRVGPNERRLELTPLGRDPLKLNLSSKAAFVLSCVGSGASVANVIEASRIPRRDAIRMLAGLMRRGALKEA